MQLLYGAEIWGWNEKILDQLEIIQNYYLRKILGFPQGTPAAYKVRTWTTFYYSKSQLGTIRIV